MLFWINNTNSALLITYTVHSGVLKYLYCNVYGYPIRSNPFRLQCCMEQKRSFCFECFSAVVKIHSNQSIVDCRFPFYAEFLIFYCFTVCRSPQPENQYKVEKFFSLLFILWSQKNNKTPTPNRFDGETERWCNRKTTNPHMNWLRFRTLCWYSLYSVFLFYFFFIFSLDDASPQQFVFVYVL